jgi:hypothetical protein
LRSLGLDTTEAELQDMLNELDTDGLKVSTDSGDTTILASTIDIVDFVAMVRKMGDGTAEDGLKETFWKFAQATPEDVKKQIFKSTEWWYGYQTSVKQAAKLESQGFRGVLDVTCIRGGPITQLEAAEMERIMKDATRDCAKSGITLKYEISYVSYREFLREYDPWCLQDKDFEAKDKELQANAKALQELRAQLARFESVPPA